MTGNKRDIPNQPAKHSFAIVKFHLPGNSYQFNIAHLDWLRKSGNRNTCYWPSEDEVRSSTQLVTLINKNAVVDKETWPVFIATVIAKFVAARDPTTSLMSPCDAKKLDDILQTNITILRGLKQKSYLTGVEGTEHRIVGKVLHKLMRYSVASQFCFKGQNQEKRCFCTTAVAAVAIESLRATGVVRLTEEQIAVKIGRRR
ncbi:Uncharacterized protein APZ42_033623 [Daphnia magna]|uniref:Uncharacterized protein n=1 Tax=Daphnia magna TaxID=35525 RepID=A0A164KXT0_9CRUS|nr:Uncharacterized protein APZ42_033623 [Daphnia magna]